MRLKENQETAKQKQCRVLGRGNCVYLQKITGESMVHLGTFNVAEARPSER